jgi:hypothetical protein
VFSVIFADLWNKEKGNDLTVQPTGGVIARNMIVSFVSKVIQVNVLIHTMIYATAFYNGNTTITMASGIEAGLWMWLGFCLVSYLNDILWDTNPKWKLLMVNAIGSLVMIILPIIAYVLLQNV